MLLGLWQSDFCSDICISDFLTAAFCLPNLKPEVGGATPKNLSRCVPFFLHPQLRFGTQGSVTSVSDINHLPCGWGTGQVWLVRGPLPVRASRSIRRLSMTN